MTELTRKKYINEVQPYRDNRVPWDPEHHLGYFDSTLQVNDPDLDGMCLPHDPDVERRRRYRDLAAWRFRGMNSD